MAHDIASGYKSELHDARLLQIRLWICSILWNQSLICANSNAVVRKARGGGQGYQRQGSQQASLPASTTTNHHFLTPLQLNPWAATAFNPPHSTGFFSSSPLSPHLPKVSQRRPRIVTVTGRRHSHHHHHHPHHPHDQTSA